MKTIGRADRIDLPEFGLYDISAKIDTGAYGCALHAHKIKVTEMNGIPLLAFQLLDPSHPEYENKTYTTEQFNDKLVKNSGGIPEHRYTIKTEVVIFGKSRLVEFSLTDRKNMKHPILIGRKFLTKRFLVDVALKDISFNLKKDSK